MLRRLARPAVLGLALGLLLGAAVLAVLGVGHLAVDCAGLSSQECAFEQDLGRQVGRLQLFGAVGLALVGGGLLLAGRKGP